MNDAINKLKILQIQCVVWLGCSVFVAECFLIRFGCFRAHQISQPNSPSTHTSMSIIGINWITIYLFILKAFYFIRQCSRLHTLCLHSTHVAGVPLLCSICYRTFKLDCSRLIAGWIHVFVSTAYSVSVSQIDFRWYTSKYT